MIQLTKLFNLKSLSILLFSLILTMDCFAQGPLTVNTAANPPEICPGESAQLFALASGGSGDYSYSWTSNPAGFSSNLPDPVVTPNVTTTYQVTVNDGINEAGGSVTVTIFDNPVPDAGNDQTIPYGTSAILQGSAGSGSGYYNFSWQPTDKLIDPYVAQPTTVNLSESTLFTLSVTDIVTGCISEQVDNVIVIITSVGIEDQEEDSGFITVIPNPNHGQFTLQVNRKVSNISIFDLTGNLIDSYNEVQNSPLEKNIDLSHYNSGMYLIKATLENGIHVNRFVMVY
jgi:hypothetical protein